MAGYTRVDTVNNIADGNVISAADLDNEFDGVQAAFNATTGHTHAGGIGEGAPITKVGPTQDVTVSSSAVLPKISATVDVGSSSLKFKEIHLSGLASIGGALSVTGIATLTAQPVLLSLTASKAVFTDALKGLVSNDITGTGNVVMSTSPTLVTPVLGTPTSVTLTNATGLPVATGISGLATGVATFLATPSSSNFAAVVTDETGTGALVFANSPTLVTPALGTPSSGTLTNATGLPIATGISGLGTGVATALAVNVGSVGAAVVNGGVLGTPSSGTLTNATGLPVATGISGLGTGVATALAVNVGSVGAAVVNGGVLGTPSSGTLTNATGLPVSTGISGLATGVATFLTTPSSANLRGVVTDETGTGDLVFANSPTLITPALGTPSSGVVTNLTGTASININGTVGATTANTGAFTSVTASADSSFNSTGAVKLSSGTTGERPTGAAGKLRFNTTTVEFEGHNGTTWASVGGSAISNDTTTATNLYPLFAAATTGTAASVYTSNAQYLFKPSTGELSVKAPRASNGIVVNSATISADYTIATGDNGMSAGPVSVNSGVTVTVSSGSVWTVV